MPIQWLVPHAGDGDSRPRGWYRHNPIPRVKPIPDRERTNCSKCDKPGAWYEFKPGSGECTECQT